MGDGAIGGGVLPAVGEAIGRHVEDAHDPRPRQVEPGEAGAWGGQPVDDQGQLIGVGPIALEQFSNRHGPPADARGADALGDFDRGEHAPGVGQRQRWHVLCGLVGGRDKFGGQHRDGSKRRGCHGLPSVSFEDGLIAGWARAQ